MLETSKINHLNLNSTVYINFLVVEITFHKFIMYCATHDEVFDTLQAVAKHRTDSQRRESKKCENSMRRVWGIVSHHERFCQTL